MAEAYIKNPCFVWHSEPTAFHSSKLAEVALKKLNFVAIITAAARLAEPIFVAVVDSYWLVGRAMVQKQSEVRLLVGSFGVG